MCGAAMIIAQNSPTLRVAVGAQAFAYLGDYSEPGKSWTRFNPGTALSLALERNRLLQFQATAGFGSISDQFDKAIPAWPEGVSPVNYFQTSFVYGDVRLKVRPFRKGFFQPYAAAGIGFLSFSPQDDRNRFLADAFLTRLSGENYATLTGQFPLSLGVDLRLRSNVSLGMEYTFRFVSSDYLDNIGKLGTRAGNDRVHGPSVWLAFNIGEKDPVAVPVEPVLPKPVEAPVAIIKAPAEVWTQIPALPAGDPLADWRLRLFPNVRYEIVP